jgi:hypothetical protein
MELTNLADVPGYLFRTVIDDTRLAAALIARVTYHINADGSLTKTADQPWILSSAPWDGPAGKMPSDQVFHRGGVDLFIFGQAWAPRQRSTGAMLVKWELSSGFRSQIAVFGDRVWVRQGRQLVASTPRPFVSLPLSLDCAYGGKDVWDGLEIPFPNNPNGKGFYLTPEQAVGKPLPNLEDPQRPIRNWNDQPDPVGMGLCPLGFGPHVRESVRFNDLGVMVELKPRFFNHAFPKMIAPQVVPGETVLLDGASPNGALRFRIPLLELQMHLRVGQSELVRPLAIDQIGIEPEKNRVFITYRFPFRYTLQPREPRSCILRASVTAI